MSDHQGDRLRAAFDAAMDVDAVDRIAWATDAYADEPALLAALLPLISSAEDIGGFLEPPDPSTADDVVLAPGELPALEGHIIADRYAIDGRLGSGGAGVVYAAVDQLTDARVAVKVLPAGGAGPDPRREAATLRLLRLPGVVHLLDDGTEDGFAYIVTDLIDGAPFPGSATPCAWGDIERVVVALLETLGRIHWAGVVHRDVKPGNVLVTAEGLPVVLDLGVSESSLPEERTRITNRYAGTLRYMAPEQLRKGAWSPQSDLYAVGAMIYEALTGVAFRSNPDAIFAGAGVALEDVEPLVDVVPETPPEVSAIVERMLAAKPVERPPSAQAVLAALPGLVVSGAPALDRVASADALRGLFHGPDRVHHLREDAACELWRRTRGEPDAMRDELGAWGRARLGRWEAGRFLIERPALQRLRAGLVLRGEPIEAAVEGDGFGQLIRLLALGEERQIVGEVRSFAEAALDQGDPAVAAAALQEGIRVARRRRDARGERALLALLLQAALLEGSRIAIDQLLYDLSRAAVSPIIEQMQHVARGALRAIDGDAEAALEQIPDPRTIEHEIVRRAAVAARLMAGRYLDQGVLGELADEATELGEGTDSAPIRRSALSARAWIAYSQDDYDRAAALHIEAAEGAETDVARMVSLANAASALLEASDLDRAERLATEAQTYFYERRHALPEARTEWIIRAAAYRRGDRLAPDPEFAAASVRVGNPNLGALATLNEAAIAWQWGDGALALELATEAAVLWRETRVDEATLLSNALAFALGADTHSGEQLLNACRTCAAPRIVVQAAALVGSRDQSLVADAADLVRRAAEQVETPPSVRLEVLSLDESRKFSSGI